MQLKTLVAVLFASVAAAAPAIDAENFTVPSGIASELRDSLPSSVLKEIATDPAAATRIASEYLANPASISSLPSDVQSWGSSALGAAESTVKPLVTPAPSAASGKGASGTQAASPSGSKGAGSDSGSDSGSGSGGSGSGKGGSGSGSNDNASSASSTGGAPAATGPLAMGVAGAAGLLGVAFAL
ncbi:hypothetical protein NUU61_007992 [Penicillium alfredii]|uniref:Uncharacterized protein n=1 Tax=Penicillium alfredii TaxID=1506179 RepID=A0A9W9JYZ3_9EURO|nr:uncharacterized protein NUU61_007992 [Penicillium alfredii]KAJ5086685.1 hypothetical protein NUU61_007992 [Penicillium alfredii]